MSPTLISAALGVAITVLTLAQVAPSLTAVLNTSTAMTGLSREESLVQHIIQYKALEGVYPATIADMTAKKYWQASDNNNGFGGAYTFLVDATKGIIDISTTIADAKNRALYVNNYRHTFKPVDMGGGVVKTSFIMPSTGAMGAPVQSASTAAIPVTATAPNAASNTFWYDTSGSTAMLKVSDGTKWAATTTVSSGGGSAPAPSATTIVASANDLPVTATTGDVRYVFNAANSTLDTLIYYNGAWTQSEVAVSPVANSNPTVTALAAQVLPIGRVAAAFYYDFKAAVSAMTLGSLSALTVDTSKVNWAVQGTLPDGLSINAATGVLSGTPTAKTAKVGTAFNVIATYGGSAGQNNYLIKVGPQFLWVTSITTGAYHSCALLTTGGVQCWGRNLEGALGDGTLTNRYSPVDVIGLTSGVKKISVGRFHTCAITAVGGAKCWGNNINGEIGDGTVVTRRAPVDVIGLTSGVTKISAGASQTCAIGPAGAAKCWGNNSNGQIGDGTKTIRLTPVDVIGLTSGVQSISTSLSSPQTCAVTGAGGGKCWGSNSVGQLGDGTSVDKSTPVDVTGLTSGLSEISTGMNTTCALTTGGAAKCWGFGYSGQLGNGTNSATSTFVDVSGLTSGVSSLNVGLSHVCALTVSGGVKCWGDNGSGQLGDGTTSAKNIPTNVTDLASGVTSLSSGNSHSCATTTAGIGRCWGLNSEGQLGDGTTVRKLTPTDLLTDSW